MPIFSWSALVFGSTATEMTGSGNTIFSSVMIFSRSHSVSPVMTSFRPTAAAMSPARTSLISVRSLACICSRRPMRSFLSLVGTYTVSPELSVPEYTRKNVRLPTNGSFRILKASAANGSSSSALRVGLFVVLELALDVGGISIGEGMNSMTASSSACTPLFLNAVPHIASTISLLMARSRRPLRISSSVSVVALEVLLEQLLVAFRRRLDHLGALLPRTRPSGSSGMSRYSNFIPWVSMSQ